MPEPQYLLILRRPGAARLLLPTLVARIPDSIAATAIAVLVRSATGSYFSAGFAAGAFGAGTAVSAPFAGRALDRLGQRRLLPLLAIGFAAALTALALASGHSGPGVLDAVAAAAGLTRPPVEAALRDVAEAGSPEQGRGGVRARFHCAGAHLDRRPPAARHRQPPVPAARLRCRERRRHRGLRCGPALRPPASREAQAGAVSPLRGGRFRVLLVPAACYGAAAGILNLSFVAFAGAHGGVAWAGVLVAIWRPPAAWRAAWLTATGTGAARSRDGRPPAWPCSAPC